MTCNDNNDYDRLVELDRWYDLVIPRIALSLSLIASPIFSHNTGLDWSLDEIVSDVQITITRFLHLRCRQGHQKNKTTHVQRLTRLRE